MNLSLPKVFSYGKPFFFLMTLSFIRGGGRCSASKDKIFFFRPKFPTSHRVGGHLSIGLLSKIDTLLLPVKSICIFKSFKAYKVCRVFFY